MLRNFLDIILPYVLIGLIIVAVIITIKIIFVFRSLYADEKAVALYKNKIVELKKDISEIREKWYTATERCSELEHKLTVYKTVAKKKKKSKTKDSNG